jgi:hypothetical protein
MAILLFLALQQDPFVMTGRDGPHRLPDGSINFYQYFRLESGPWILTADRASYQPQTGIVEVNGSVQISNSQTAFPLEIAADRAVFDLLHQSGSFEEVAAQFGEEFYFKGAGLQIHGDRSFHLQAGKITACNQPTPHWEITIASAYIVQEGYARMRKASLRLAGIPVLTLPYLIAPAMTERTSGLLTPRPGDSSRNGFYFGLPLYWAPRQDMDFTFTPTLYQDAGLQLDAEWRYALSRNVAGRLFFSTIADQVINRLREQNAPLPMEDGRPISSQRFRLEWDHMQALAGGQILSHGDGGSDFQFDRDYTLETKASRLRDYSYSLQYHKPIGDKTLFLEFLHSERIMAGTEAVSQWQALPRLQWVQPAALLPGRWMFQGRAYLEYLKLEQSTFAPTLKSMARLGINANFSHTRDLAAWLRTHSTLGVSSYLWKGKGQESLVGGPFAALELKGPRIFGRLGGTKGPRHLLEASLESRWGVAGDDPIIENLVFNELDSLLEEQSKGLETHLRVRSHFYSTKGSLAEPQFDLELSQKLFHGDEDAPMVLRARMAGLRWLQGTSLLVLDPSSGDLETISLYARLGVAPFQADFGYVQREDQGSELEALIGAAKVHWGKARLHYAYDYDFLGHQFKSQELGIHYAGDCLGFSGRYVSSPFTGTSADREWFQLTLHFRNLGDWGKRF